MSDAEARVKAEADRDYYKKWLDAALDQMTYSTEMVLWERAEKESALAVLRLARPIVEEDAERLAARRRYVHPDLINSSDDLLARIDALLKSTTEGER